MTKQAHNDYITDIERIIRQLDFRGVAKVLTVCYDETDRIGAKSERAQHQRLQLVKGGVTQ